MLLSYSEDRWVASFGVENARWVADQLERRVEFSLPPARRVQQVRAVFEELRTRAGIAGDSDDLRMQRARRACTDLLARCASQRRALSRSERRTITYYAEHLPPEEREHVLLMVQRAAQPKARTVPIIEDPGQHLVYLLYDVNDLLLYIGITDRGPQRLVEHWKNKPWVWRVARVEFERCVSRAVAAKREVVLIQRLRPLYNVQHNSRRFA